MGALAEFRTGILALLDDASNTRYSSAQVDQGLRWALNHYTLHRPQARNYQLECDGQGVVEFPADFSALRITRCQLWADDIDDYVDVRFNAWKEDGSWFIETVDAIYTSDDVLVISYATTHTIDDLDSAAGTTIPAEDEHLLQVGAAGYTARMRLVSLVESNVLQEDAVQRLKQISDSYIAYLTVALNPPPSSGCAELPAVPSDAF